MSIDLNAAAQMVSFYYTLPGARTKGDIGEGCLLLRLISVGLPASSKNGLHRGVRRTARSSAENPINFNRRQLSMEKA